jgi:hypothetical protein
MAAGAAEHGFDRGVIVVSFDCYVVLEGKTRWIAAV